MSYLNSWDCLTSEEQVQAMLHWEEDDQGLWDVGGSAVRFGNGDRNELWPNTDYRHVVEMEVPLRPKVCVIQMLRYRGIADSQ